ncbi:MAG TPA: TetR/AcrR family transcriptional regulator [Acidimicrobiales bacterium]|nr:TetR/AcrR family transcriptional regulator [Acidimicrobiales bacterium]
MARIDAREHRRDDRRDARRVQLLDAAIEAVREIGPSATMEQLARAGGVTKPILYRHFRDRDGLITAIAERFSVELLSAIERALLTSEEPRFLLEHTVDAYLSFIEREPALYRFLLRQAGGRGASGEGISPLIDAIARQVALVVGDQLRVRGQDSGGAVPWAYGIVGLVYQAGDWWLEDRTMTRETLTRYLTALLWHGLDQAADTVPGEPTS